jgi:hypothetical protein
MLYRVPSPTDVNEVEYKSLVVQFRPEEPGQPYMQWKCHHTTLNGWYIQIYQTRIVEKKMHPESTEIRLCQIIRDVPDNIQAQIECEMLCKSLARGDII